MSGITRRGFLKLTGTSVVVGTATLSTSLLAQQPAETSSIGSTALPYPREPIAALKQLKVNQPLAFTYPDSSSPCVMIKKGKAVTGGVGPDQDIVGYSILCSHMGCPVMYDQASETFKCPCHFSIFDPDKSGQMVTGQATENLPQIVLTYNDAEETIEAIAVNGLIYGRQANII
ncbi:MAG: arsenate reductase (azurin) small subunit [Chloroflexota bacterium]